MKEEIISKYQRLRIQKNFGRFLLKYTPYQVTLVFVIFCIWRGLGHDNFYVACSLGATGIMWMPYIFVSSTSSGFCFRHRLLIIYDFAVVVLMYCEGWWGFGAWRRPLNWICAAVGGALLLNILILTLRKKELCKACRMSTANSWSSAFSKCSNT